MEDFGELRCIHCHHWLQIMNDYPWVGSILYCTDCRGYMKVKGHYLEYNGRISFKLSILPPETLAKISRRLSLGMKPHETP